MENDKIYLVRFAKKSFDGYYAKYEFTIAGWYKTFSEAEDMVINHPEDLDENHLAYDSVYIVEITEGVFIRDKYNNVIYKFNDATRKYEETYASGPVNRD